MSTASSESCFKSVLEKSDKILSDLGLRIFILNLPLKGASSSCNQRGIHDKILRNCSYSNLEYQTDVQSDSNNSDERSVTPWDDSKRERVVTEIVDKLLDTEVSGFVLVVAEAEKSNSESADGNSDKEYRPIVGAVVELVDDHERCLRGFFTRRTMPSEVSDYLAKIVFTRTMAHAFQWQFPGGRKNNPNKLVSTLDTHMNLFPIDTYDFISKGAQFSKHWETENDAGSHNDNPLTKCSCYKLQNKADSWIFWGMSESRFVKLWKINETVFIPEAMPNAVEVYFLGKVSSSKTENNNTRKLPQYINTDKSNLKKIKN